MAGVSLSGLQMDADLYNRVVTAYKNGNKNELIRFVLEQYNWSMCLSRQFEDVIPYNQSRRMTVLYITLAKIANAVTGKGEYNLFDTRPNTVIGHKGWYVRDYILKDVVEKVMPEFNNVRQMFDRGQSFMSPEYGVVQSVITAQDLRMWTEVYKQGNFGHKDTTANSYFADAQQVFSNIVQGRSIVLLTNDTLQALKDFTSIFADEKSPMYKPEYKKTINEAVRIVNQDIIELNKVLQKTADR